MQIFLLIFMPFVSSFCEMNTPLKIIYKKTANKSGIRDSAKIQYLKENLVY